MNRITRLFESDKRNILSIYFCAGYPSEDTESIISALEHNGVDMIEIGIPFSDPMADGEVIQNAATHALRNGMSLKKLFSQLGQIPSRSDIPHILMGYLNPIMQYGFEEFCQSCQSCHIDGCIIPDLPFKDYLSDYKPIADKYDLKIIMLITPETSDDRVILIDKHTDSFIYMVSSASTTGAQKDFNVQKQAYFQRINAMKLRNPLMVGFGISNEATFATACENSRGGIIGSKFISLLSTTESPGKAIITLKKAIGR